MITNGVKKIPEAHIMKRWTRNAHDFEYPDEVCTSAGEQLGQNLLYANALEVVKSTDKNPKAGEILMRYLNMARKEIDGIETEKLSNMPVSNGSTSEGETTGIVSETEGIDQLGYEPNAQRIVTNTYGASGSSAYMSDADIQNIQAPLVPKQTGRRRETWFKPLFERKRKGRKRYRACLEIGEARNHKGKMKKSYRQEGFGTDD